MLQYNRLLHISGLCLLFFFVLLTCLLLPSQISYDSLSYSRALDIWSNLTRHMIWNNQSRNGSLETQLSSSAFEYQGLTYDYANVTGNATADNGNRSSSTSIAPSGDAIFPNEIAQQSNNLTSFSSADDEPRDAIPRGDGFLPKIRNANCSKLYDQGSPLRVYVYELPTKYHFGAFDQKWHDEVKYRDFKWRNVTSEDIPPFPMVRGYQHSVSYHLFTSLLTSSKEVRSNVVIMVDDPLEADVFFVPVFGVYFSDVKETKEDYELQEFNVLTFFVQLPYMWLLKYLKESPWWKRSNGRDHVIDIHHPNSLRLIRDDLANAIFLVADFARTKRSTSRLSKDVVAPYVHAIIDNIEEKDPWQNRNTFIFFQAGIRYKAGGFLRKAFYDKYKKEKGFVLIIGKYSQRGISHVRLSTFMTNMMQKSRFCLHMAGDTPSTCRLFDAIASSCIPIVISHQLELPFESIIDYSKFCLFFSPKDALDKKNFLGRLRSITQSEYLKMWTRLKQMQHHFDFQIPSRCEDASSMIWHEIHSKLPAVKLFMHRDHRMVSSDWWTYSN